MAISLGDALLKLGVDSKDLEQGMALLDKSVSQKLDKMGTKFLKTGAAMTAMGTAIIAGLWKLTDSYTKAGDEVAKMAKRTGLGVETLSEMRHVAGLSGTSLSELEVGIRKMQSTIVDAGYGLETYTRAFDELGLKLEDIKAMSPEQQFWTIAEAISEVEDPTLRAAIAVDMFGRSGTNMLPMLAEGKEGIAAMRQEAHDLNMVFTDETAKAAEDFQDSQERMQAALKGLGAAMSVQLMPIFEEFIKKITTVVGHITEWVKVNPELAGTLLKIGAILVAGGAILMGLGMLAKAIVAINAALIIMHSLAGPAGWIKIAAGAAIAAGAIAAMYAMMNKVTAGIEAPGGKIAKSYTYQGAEYTPEEWENMQDFYRRKGLEPPIGIPSYQFGGTVPGPIGAPVPIIAHGGEEYMGVQNMGKPMGNTVNINLGLLPGDDVTIRKFAKMIKDVLGEDGRRNAFGQVNQGYFFGRSSV